MKIATFFCSLLFILFIGECIAQPVSHKFSVKVEIDEELQSNFKKDGRLYVFLSENMRAEPRTQTWPSPAQKTYIFAQNITSASAEEGFVADNSSKWISTVSWSLDEVPQGNYNFQVLWDQDETESRINAPGNLYSEKQMLAIEGEMSMMVSLSKEIPPNKVVEHELTRTIDMKSDLLSAFWGKPMNLKAAILLPRNYDDTKAYPIRYNVAGYGGRYYRVNNLLRNEEFMSWWQSDDAPAIVNVFLDGEGPFGDSYQMDSENSGPYGESLIKELIPHIEAKYRGASDANTRFVDGCSTGGWVSLGLQLYYPDDFNGVFSYSPDAIEFSNYQLVNIYQDENAYVNEFGYPRPVMRSVMGEPMLQLNEFIQYENVLGSSNSYLNSGGQFSAHNALYSPKGENGLPKAIFDPISGEIDRDVAEYWKKYDFKLHTEENWAELGPKVAGKIYVWMGDMDNFYLNPATRVFDNFLTKMENPKSDAVIEFSPMEGHCSQYSNKKVLMQMAERLESLK
jgi:enterochelin esterase-like enzyme